MQGRTALDKLDSSQTRRYWAMSLLSDAGLSEKKDGKAVAPAC
jgi:hypothetical protein